jgi:hypothetical protein
MFWAKIPGALFEVYASSRPAAGSCPSTQLGMIKVDLQLLKMLFIGS